MKRPFQLLFLFLLFSIILVNSSFLEAKYLKNRLYLKNALTLDFRNNNYFFNNSNFNSSPGKAFLKSLLLPGWGEFSAKADKRGKSFLISEGILWSGFVALRIYASWKQSDLESFAIEKAGVNSSGKDKAYYTDISNFYNIYEYNEEKRKFRQYDEVYPVDENHFWQWRSAGDQKKFDQLRISREQAVRNATLVVGGILVNHVLSAIDAIWVTHQRNKNISSVIRFSPDLNQYGQLSLNFTVSTSW